MNFFKSAKVFILLSGVLSVSAISVAKAGYDFELPTITVQVLSADMRPVPCFRFYETFRMLRWALYKKDRDITFYPQYRFAWKSWPMRKNAGDGAKRFYTDKEGMVVFPGGHFKSGHRTRKDPSYQIRGMYQDHDRTVNEFILEAIGGDISELPAENHFILSDTLEKFDREHPGRACNEANDHW